MRDCKLWIETLIYLKNGKNGRYQSFFKVRISILLMIFQYVTVMFLGRCQHPVAQVECVHVSLDTLDQNAPIALLGITNQTIIAMV